jgi:hypothetical protein
MNFKTLLFFIMLLVNLSVSAWAGGKTPEQLLTEVYKNSAELASAKAKLEVEKALVAKSYFLSDPTLGMMTESKGGEKMEFLTITQEIMFPTKYFSMGTAQKARARAAQSQFAQTGGRIDPE